MTLIQQLQQILGNVPAGYEIVQYIFGGVFLLVLISYGFSLIAGIINSLTGR